MKILLLGAPGAGKGTQAKILSKELKTPIISMGDMLREMIKTDVDLKEKVLPYMKEGKLVPNEIVGEILKKRIEKDDCKKGFILDGYPRNEEQARLIDTIGISVDKVIEIYVKDEVIIDRLVNRKVCEKCGETFNVNFNKPKKDGVCDFCQGRLVSRPDDELETIKKRIEVFRQQTKPLEEYYDKQGKFFVVDGEKGVENVSEMILFIVEANKND